MSPGWRKLCCVTFCCLKALPEQMALDRRSISVPSEVSCWCLRSGITRILEQESLEVTVWGSPDGEKWETKAAGKVPSQVLLRPLFHFAELGISRRCKVSARPLEDEPVEQAREHAHVRLLRLRGRIRRTSQRRRGLTRFKFAPFDRDSVSRAECGAPMSSLWSKEAKARLLALVDVIAG